MRASPLMTLAMVQSQVLKRIVDGLQNRKAKPITKLGLLRIIKVMFCEHHDIVEAQPHQSRRMVEMSGMSTVVQELGCQDEAVLVRQVSSGINASEYGQCI